MKTQHQRPTTCPGVGGNAKIVATESVPEREGEYPGFVALVCKEFATFPDRPWSTHLVYFNYDMGEWQSCWGHYDQTEAEAREDFAKRCLARR